MYPISKAEITDEAEIMKLYRSMIGKQGCTWDENYPNEEIFRKDVSDGRLFCMKNGKGEIVSVISIDQDEEVDLLECWNKKFKKAAELARLVVREDYQNRSIAREMIRGMMKLLKEKGYDGVHFLVSQTNEKALASYKKLHFEQVGESNLFSERWFCYEIGL